MTTTQLTRSPAIGVAAGALLLGAQSAMALDNAGSVQGVVKNGAGQPVTGAFVRLKNADKRLTFMVVSQNGGSYSAKDLPPGNYTVQAIGGANQSAISAPVAVASGKPATMDGASNAPRRPMLTPPWPRRLPDVQIAQVAKYTTDMR